MILSVPNYRFWITDGMDGITQSPCRKTEALCIKTDLLPAGSSAFRIVLLFESFCGYKPDADTWHPEPEVVHELQWLRKSHGESQ